MALTDTDVRQLFSGDDSTTSFAIPFTYYEESEVVVILQASDGTETVQVVGASNDYTLTGGDANTLPTTVEMNTAPATGEKLLVLRNTPNTQPLDIIKNGNLDADALEKQLDKIVAQIQDVEEKVARAIKFKKTSDEVGQALPEAEANKFPIWNDTGTALINISEVPTGLAEINAHITDTTTHGTTGDIVGTTDTQTLTNKTLTSPTINTPTITGLIVDAPDIENGMTMEQISTPSDPGAGDVKVYPKSDDKLYTLNSASTEETIAYESLVPVMTAWASYTPSLVGFGTTPTGLVFWWRRVGENMEIRGKFLPDTPTAVEAQIPLPNSEEVNSTSVPSVMVVGDLYYNGATTGSYPVLATGGDAFLNIGKMSSGTAGGVTPQNGDDIGGNVLHSFFASVPIDGWSLFN